MGGSLRRRHPSATRSQPLDASEDSSNPEKEGPQTAQPRYGPMGRGAAAAGRI